SSRRRRSSTSGRSPDTCISEPDDNCVQRTRVLANPMRTGVLLMAHGTPSSMDDMPEYLRLVRGGRPPSDELVAEMRHNYEAIGGRSPLTELTLAQGEALAERLDGIPV